MPQWLQDRLIIPAVLKRELAYKGPVLIVPHHHSHAASTFLVSPFEEAGILIADGVGEYACSSFGYGKANSLELTKQIDYPNSLGLLYTAITTFLGFKANSGEGTTMALASFGKPVFLKEFEKIINIADDGSYTVNTLFLSLNKRKRMYSNKMIRLLGEPRKFGSEYLQRHKERTTPFAGELHQRIPKQKRSLWLEALVH